MKKNLFFALLLAVSTAINAQTSPISFGVKGGYSLSNLKVASTSMDSKSFFYAGISAEKPLSPKIGLQAEVVYTQLGGKDKRPILSFAPGFGNISSDYKLNQIQVPISIKYYLIPKLSASIVMNFGFNISKKLEESSSLFGNTEENLDSVKTLNLFPFLGAEYKITEKFFVDARYNFNFFEINKSNDVSTKVGFLQAGVGYRFK